MDPNVLLVVLDSVRARNTSLHGYPNDTTPFLRSFAEDRATVYTQARSPAATSLTSHASVFTGTAVPEHGLTTTDTRLKQGHTVFERLRDSGYDTGVFSENTWITEVDVGLNRGFDTVVGPQNMPFPDAVDPRQFVAERGRGQYREYLREAMASGRPLRSLANGLAVKLEYDYPNLLPSGLSSAAPGEVYLDAFLRWQAEREGPWAACLNLMDAHIPYDPPQETDLWGGDRARTIQDEVGEQKWEFAGGLRPWWQKRALEGLYDGGIRYADDLLASLVADFESRDALEDTLLVITADHGEGFGERSHVRPDVRIAEHNVAVHEALTHVPLVVNGPGQSAGERVDDLVSLSAFPRAVEQARDGVDPSFVTEDPVVATAVGLDEPKQARARPYVDDLTPYTATSRAVYERGSDGRVRKYVTWRDRSLTVEIPDTETSFVAADTDEEKVDAAFSSLSDRGITEDGTAVSDMDEGTRERLEDLGYV